jgi:hypothetical protein
MARFLQISGQSPDSHFGHHFHVANDYLRKRQDAAQSSMSQPIRDLTDLIIRDRSVGASPIWAKAVASVLPENAATKSQRIG